MNIFKLIILMSLILINNPSGFCSTTEDVELTKNESIEELNNINSKYSFVYQSGKERYGKFYNYFLGNNNQINENNQNLSYYFANLKNIPAGQLLSIEQATELVEMLMHFSKIDRMHVFQKNTDPNQNTLFHFLVYYTYGAQRALDKLEEIDLKHINEILILKNKISNSMSQYLTATNRNNISDEWELTYLLLSQSYYLNFDAEIVHALSNNLSVMIKSENTNTIKRKTASNLLLQISLICFTKCTSPSLKINSNLLNTYDYYLKKISENCYKYCESDSTTTQEMNSFYKKYLLFLKNSNDLEYNDIKNKIHFIKSKSYFSKAISNAIKAKQEYNFIDFYLIIKYSLLGIVTFLFSIYQSIGFISVLYVIVVVSNLMFGKNKLNFIQLELTKDNKLIKFKNLIIFIFLNFLNLSKNLIANIISSYSKDSSLINRISSNLLTISFTLTITRLFSYLEKIIN